MLPLASRSATQHNLDPEITSPILFGVAHNPRLAGWLAEDDDDDDDDNDADDGDDDDDDDRLAGWLAGCPK